MPVRSDILDRDTHAGVLRVSDSPADAGSGSAQRKSIEVSRSSAVRPRKTYAANNQ